MSVWATAVGFGISRRTRRLEVPIGSHSADGAFHERAGREPFVCNLEDQADHAVVMHAHQRLPWLKVLIHRGVTLRVHDVEIDTRGLPCANGRPLSRGSCRDLQTRADAGIISTKGL